MKRGLRLRVFVPLVLGLVLSLALLGFAEFGHRRLEAANSAARAGLGLQAAVYEVLGLVAEAESGQRGYFLTGRADYLRPYDNAVRQMRAAGDRLRDAASATATQEQRASVSQLLALIERKLAEMEASLALYRTSGAEGALAMLGTDLGKRTMDEVRDVALGLLRDERMTLDIAHSQWQRDIDLSRLGMQTLTALTIALLLVIWLISTRELRLRESARTLQAENQARLEREVDARTAELSELSAHLQQSSEHEKTRLAREIHDELGSLLVSAKMDVSWVHARIAAADHDGAARLTRALETLDEGVSVKRRLIEDLRPTLLDNLGIAAAVEWQARQICDRAGIECVLELDEELVLPADVSIGLYRVVQESLTNVVKYAQARRVWIELVADSRDVSLSIRDDGIGIGDVALRNRLSHGILGMRQRMRMLGGEFEITGVRGQGTRIEVHVPRRRAPLPDAGVTQHAAAPARSLAAQSEFDAPAQGSTSA